MAQNLNKEQKMSKNAKNFQNIMDSIQVASGYQETKVPFIRPKQVSRFRPMGLEPKIDITSFGKVINRTLYLTFKYLWFRDKKRPTDRIVVDIADGSFDFDYLRPGNYKVWAISKILYGVNQLDTTIVQDVTISGKSEEKDLGTIRIYTNKN